jgi:2-polyprenyl-6-methoxyphenol hydroxylase-like FAD-dependent oxidoreductase
MYEAPRQRANVGMMTALDSLQKVFQPQEGWLAQTRAAGLGLINSSTLAKQQIMKYAMGL